MQGLTTWNKIHFRRVLCLLRSPFGYAICEANWILLWCCLKLGTGCFHSGDFWVWLWCRPMRDTACDRPWQTVWSYIVIQSLSLPFLDLGVHGKDQAAHQGLCFYQHQAQGQVSKSANPPPLFSASAFLYLSPLASCLIGSVTERAPGGPEVSWDRFSVSHQVGMCSFHQIYTGSNLVPVLGLRALQKRPKVYQV